MSKYQVGFLHITELKPHKNPKYDTATICNLLMRKKKPERLSELTSVTGGKLEFDFQTRLSGTRGYVINHYTQRSLS